MSYKYYLTATIAGEQIKREVSIAEYCKAERVAGFRPKLASTDPKFMTTPATGGFNMGAISGTSVWEKEQP